MRSKTWLHRLRQNWEQKEDKQKKVSLIKGFKWKVVEAKLPDKFYQNFYHNRKILKKIVFKVLPLLVTLQKSKLEKKHEKRMVNW